MLRWMLGNLLVWAVLFFGVPYAGVRFVPPEAGMMFTMALWMAVYPLYIALASHSAAQRKWNTLWLPLVHPALYALGVWLVFHTVPELAYCAGYLAVGYGFWGAGWGMKRRRQRRVADQRFGDPGHAEALFQHFDDALAQAAFIDGLQRAGRLFVERQDDAVGEREVAVGKVGQGRGVGGKAFRQRAADHGQEAFLGDGGGIDVGQEFAVRFVFVQLVGEQHVHPVVHQGAEVFLHALGKGIDGEPQIVARLLDLAQQIGEHVDGKRGEADDADEAVRTAFRREFAPGLVHALHDLI